MHRARSTLSLEGARNGRVVLPGRSAGQHDDGRKRPRPGGSSRPARRAPSPGRTADGCRRPVIGSALRSGEDIDIDDAREFLTRLWPVGRCIDLQQSWASCSDGHRCRRVRRCRWGLVAPGQCEPRSDAERRGASRRRTLLRSDWPAGPYLTSPGAGQPSVRRRHQPRVRQPRARAGGSTDFEVQFHASGDGRRCR